MGHIRFQSLEDGQKSIRAKNCTKNLTVESYPLAPKKSFSKRREKLQINLRKHSEKKNNAQNVSPQIKNKQEHFSQSINTEGEKSDEKEAPNKSVSKKVTSAVNMALNFTEMVMKSQDKISTPKILSQNLETNVLVPAKVEDENVLPDDTHNLKIISKISPELDEEAPEMNLDNIFKYLSQNNIPLNLEHLAQKSKTIEDRGLQSIAPQFDIGNSRFKEVSFFTIDLNNNICQLSCHQLTYLQLFK